jgi:altronate hydrolase
MTSRNPKIIQLHRSDNVAVARADLSKDEVLALEDGRRISCREVIPAGHKVAVASIPSGDPVRKYGQIIGFAVREILPGEHVHLHNMAFKGFVREHDIGADARPLEIVDKVRRATFLGIVRPDGRVAVRNFIGVLSTVNCSATVARRIQAAFGPEELSPFSQVDGVVAVCHGTGCAMDTEGEGFRRLQRTLVGYARHPNFGGILLVGLGCEDNQIEALLREGGLEPGPQLRTLVIQEVGGTEVAVEEGIKLVKSMLPLANRVTREEVTADRLVVGLECGGSDAYSGITANPALGAAVDRLVLHGGTAILSETPEIYGAEHLLTRRAASPEVGEKLIEVIRWWEDYTARHGGVMDNNPTPGNKAGGLTTVLEKSLGAVAKGGTTNLMEVYPYAEAVRSQGLVFMDTPGYDPASVTGMVAGGAHLICFTTGRGSAFGCKPSPVIKLAATTSLFQRMEGDMDINCGTILEGEESVEEVGERIFREILEVASGKRTKSEGLGMGDHEFVPWQLGVQM